MEYVQLGSSEYLISRLGLGCWALGGHGYGIVDDRDSIAMIREAVDFGVNFFDTADTYGFGHSESVIAKALGGSRQNMVIATKFGVRWDDTGVFGKDIRPSYLVEALENSLRRLKMEKLPLYQIHWPDGKTKIEDTMAALVRCQEAGKIDQIGCCNVSIMDIDAAQNIAPLSSYQCRYNLVDRNSFRMAEKLHREYKITILPYEVLGRGLFSGKHKQGDSFGKADTRQVDPNFSDKNLYKMKNLLNLLTVIGNKHGVKPAQVAICWVLGQEFVGSALVGCKTVEQLSENIAATQFQLEVEDRAALNEIVTM